MAKREFMMNGKSYATLTAIAAELGVKRVYTRDFAKYGITEVTTDTTTVVGKSVNILDDTTSAQDDTTVVDDGDQPDTTDTADVQDAKVEDNPLTTGGSSIIFAHVASDGIAVDKVIDITPKATDIQTITVEPEQDDTDVQVDDAVDAVEATDDTVSTDVLTDEDTPQSDEGDEDAPQSDEGSEDTAVEATDDTTADAPASTPDATTVQQPQTEDELIAKIEQDVVDYEDANELGKAVKKISLQGLIKMVKNIQGDDWERISNEGIRKMRLIMELKRGYFPSTYRFSPSVPSPWKKIPTSDLKAAAVARGQTWKDCSNEGILRMRLIMVLKAAGVTADELTK